MIRVFPKPELSFSCPVCQSKTEIQELLIAGMRPLARTHCTQCAREFFQDLPVSHALHYPTSIDVKTGELFFTGLDWYPLLLKQAWQSRTKEQTYSIRLRGEQKHQRLIVLNCLDTYYGHSLLKLLNANYYLDRHSDCDLLLIVPAFLAWMVPSNGLIRSLIIDIPLKESYRWIASLNQELQQTIFPSYDEVLLSPGYSHPHPTQADLKRFIPGIEPLSLASLISTSTSDEPIRVTYITREDRLWITSEQISRLFLKYGSTSPVRLFKQIIILYQNKKIERLYQLLKRRFPKLIFTVAGLATTGSFHSDIIDARKTKLTPEEEQDWCRLYAKSHLVIGIHGSNMLLPSAFAGMTLNLLPYFKFGNFLQDILVQEPDTRLALYRYRHLPIDTTIRTIAKTAISQIASFKKSYTNTIVNTHLEKDDEK